jgi:hypothetical protein
MRDIKLEMLMLRCNTPVASSQCGLLCLLLFCVAAGCGTSTESAMPHDPAMRAARLMRMWQKGQFNEVPSKWTLMGWRMTNEDGKGYDGGALRYHASKLIPLGREAVPELVRWLKNDEMQMRFIANEALHAITGVKVYFPTFATIAQHRKHGWLDKARKAYMDWYKSGDPPARLPTNP